MGISEPLSDEFLGALEQMLNEAKQTACPPCVKCGWCCRHTVCYYGEWDYEKNQCKYLTEDNLCSKFEEINTYEEAQKLEIRLFGSGCCLNYENPDRLKILNQMDTSDGKV
ncbi:hypothetical protein [Fervidobacterium islandicum]|uniref:hypothetical protein n=1 Tax=Fervidobacterium islandicum TaxID=2423 RepID=UPI003A757E9B